MQRPLTSTASPRVKAVRALHTRKGRKESGTFLAEGPQAVAAALAAGADVREVFATEIVAGSLDLGDVVVVSDEVLAAMAETVTPQGVVAVCGIPRTGLDSVLDGAGPVVVVESLSDPGNLGTIIRTADAAGARSLLLTEGSVDPYNGKSVRASAGSIFHLPCVTEVTLDDAVTACRRAGLPVVGATADGVGPVSAVAPPVAWLFGSEAHGLSGRARQLADMTAYIPMPGRAESLNVAVAVAVCLFAHVPDTRRP